ncbi:MAG: DMT family transporter [Candidatus Micrarchaeaceae archaeon]
MMTKHEAKAFAMLSLAILELAFLPIALDIGGSSLDFASYLFYTFAVGTAVSLLMLVATRKASRLKQTFANKSLVARIGIIGILNYAVAAIFLTIGTMHTSASFGGAIYRMWVLLSILFIPFILRIKVNAYQIVSLLIAFVALYIAMTNGTFVSVNASELPFIALLVFSAIAAALSNVLMKATTADLASEVFLFNLFSLAFMLPILPFAGISLHVSMLSLLVVLFAGGITYSIGSFLYFYALRGLDVAIVGNATLLVPFLTFLFAYLLLGEPVYSYYILLAGLIVVGMLVQRISPHKAAEYIKRRKDSKVKLFDITNVLANNSMASEYMKNSGKALATKGSICSVYENLGSDAKESLASKYKCIAFTNSKPLAMMGDDEIEFMEKSLGKNEPVLVGIGEASNLEDFFADLEKMQYSNGNLPKTEKFANKF